jgi:hypothetical protein
VKITKWLGATGAVLALGAVGFITVPAANGATLTLTAGAGSSAHCTITGTAKVSPGLANNWDPSAHTNDPDTVESNNATIKAAMASIPATTYGVAGTTTVSAKIPAVCTGTIVDPSQGSATTTLASATFSAVSATAGDGTCGGLVGDVGTSTFTTTITWKGTSSTKINPTTVTSTLGALADGHGIGFDLKSSSSQIVGSFAGPSTSNTASEVKAYIDSTTEGAELGSAATFDNPTATSSLFGPDVCEPQLSEKFTPASPGVSDAVAIKLKKPKGLKAIGIITTPDNTQSTLTMSR